MPEPSDPLSEKELLAKLKAGEKTAANELIAKYFERVIRAARRRIDRRRLRGTASEDIAASVFESLWKKADKRMFAEEDLISSEEFWRLLSSMVRFKTEDHLRRERALKRGGGRQRGESAFVGPARNTQAGPDAHSGNEFTPLELATFQDQHDRFMGILNDEILQEVVTLRLEGNKVADIAGHFDRSERWVKRKLALIREIWMADNDQ